MIGSASGERDSPSDDEDHLPTAVSSALALALLLGTVQALVFVIGARQILQAAGIDHASAMYIPALSFMRARALSSPTSTLWLVATNVFRGLGDATTPMLCAVLFNVVNMVGDYVLIEKVKVGIAGTALGTTIAQFVALIPLLVVLNQKVPYWMSINRRSFGRYLSRYGRAGVFLVGRSIARIAAVSYISRRSVRSSNKMKPIFEISTPRSNEFVFCFFLYRLFSPRPCWGQWRLVLTVFCTRSECG